MHDAAEITTPNQVSLPYLPTTPIVETLSWNTMIFKSAAGAERREALMRYPNYYITYSFTFTFGEKDLLESMIRDSETVDWVVPLIYQLSPISSYKTRRSPYYPVFSFVALVNPLCGNIVYKQLDLSTDPHDAILVYRHPFSANQVELLTGGDIFVCPCVSAAIEPNVSSQQVGLGREGDMLTLSWRWRGEYEGRLHYTDTFSFVASAQSPLAVTKTPAQVNFGDSFSEVYRYVPAAQGVGVGIDTSVEYYLETEGKHDDYFFRGAMLAAKGGELAQHYIYGDTLHRLAGDSVSITYDQRVARASMSVREVTA